VKTNGFFDANDWRKPTETQEAAAQAEDTPEPPVEKATTGS